MNKNSAKELALVIVAAGSSSRMGGIKKEYLKLDSGTVLSTSAKVFLTTLPFSAVCVTYPQKDESERIQAEDDCKAAFFVDSQISTLIKKHDTNVFFTMGGSSRQESVLNALKQLKSFYKKSNPIVFIHDGARPFVDSKIITQVHNATEQYGAAVPAISPTDTQKEITPEGFILKHLVRSNLAAVQTPQAFLLNELYQAHQKAKKLNKEFTDDTEIWDSFVPNSKVRVVQGNIKNKKITYKEDIIKGKDKKMIRTGLGYDKHILKEGRPLMLGGIEIPFNKGEDGHSDGDVLLHAITDALLGACGMGDIGSFFPPEESKWKDADSKMLLKTVWNKITEQGWSLGNLDCVIALEKPKFLPYRQKVIDSIAKVLNVASEQIFVKAKTGEKLGDIGEGRAIETWATCLLQKD